MYVILVYDVGQKRVGKMLKLCRRYLSWIQNSVFEGEISLAKLEELKLKALDIMDVESDSLIIFQTRQEKWLKKEIVGIDVFFDFQGTPSELAEGLAKTPGEDFRLAAIGNRGTEVWPSGASEVWCSDHWRCRYALNDIADQKTAHRKIAGLMGRIAITNLDFIKTEHLCTFDGANGFSGAL